MDESEKVKIIQEAGSVNELTIEDARKLAETARQIAADLQADLDQAVLEGGPTAPPAWPEESAAGPAEEAPRPPARVVPNRHDRRKAAALARREAKQRRTR